MGMIQGKPYWQKKNGTWVKVTPEPKEMAVKVDRKEYNKETNRKRLLNEKRRRNMQYGY